MSQMYNSLFQFLECPPKHPFIASKQTRAIYYIFTSQLQGARLLLVSWITCKYNIYGKIETLNKILKKIRKKTPPKHPDN